MQTRIRITFTKKGALRYTGHLDFQQVWERSLRRSNLPIAYSQGYHPQARLHLACALPLGFSSLCEIMDFWLMDNIELQVITDLIRKSIPPGITIISAEKIDLQTPPLQLLVRSSHYMVTFLDPINKDLLGNHINDLLAATEIKRHRHNKEYDLRPLVEALFLLPNDEMGFQRLVMHLSAREGATGRPEEVLSVLGMNLTDTRIVRTTLVLAGI